MQPKPYLTQTHVLVTALALAGFEGAGVAEPRETLKSREDADAARFNARRARSYGVGI